jgi:hypothetical protein
MNWKLIFLLSLFGLAMAFATVYVVPSNIEPLIWLPIFLVCAWLIGRYAPGKPFVHGLMVGIVNSIWITAAHVALFDPYLAHHAKEADMMKTMPATVSPRVMMACVGPIVGVISGAVIGLFAMLAWRLARRRGSAPTPA